MVKVVSNRGKGISIKSAHSSIFCRANRVALDNDLPVSKVREDMVAAIHEAAQNPTELYKAVFGDREPTPEEMIAVLAQMIDEVELEEADNEP